MTNVPRYSPNKPGKSKLVHERHEKHEINQYIILIKSFTLWVMIYNWLFSLNILRAFALRRNACLPHFVLFVSCVDKSLFFMINDLYRINYINHFIVASKKDCTSSMRGDQECRDFQGGIRRGLKGRLPLIKQAGIYKNPKINGSERPHFWQFNVPEISTRKSC